jgi:hypothetical protein
MDRVNFNGCAAKTTVAVLEREEAATAEERG